MLGWCNRLLRVDLSNGHIEAQETAPYFPSYLGARGLAAKVLWDEYPEPVDPFSPDAPLMFVPGALTGTTAPYSGRTCISGFGPQGYPYPWFTRSNIGGGWGGRLKRAGYDGLVVTGCSETPVYILIRDDTVSIVPAEELWGVDSFETQQRLQSLYGRTARSLTIGPAGERLSRIATIQTDTTNAAGQGGFGAVMGAKKLKAVTVVSTGKVEVADAERLRWLTQAIGDEVRPTRRWRSYDALNQALAAEGGGRARPYACTEGCPSPCQTIYSDVPGCAFDRKWSGALACVSGRFGGGMDTVYSWKLGQRATVELNLYANELGLNHWDILVGMIPWLRACHLNGLLPEVNGKAFDLNSSDFWVHLLRAMAYREGMGDALAEGGWRGALQLGLGVDLMRRYYTGWGYAGHWDGHAAFTNTIVYPFWIVSALHWAMDTRDPASSTHCYVQNVMRWSPLREALSPWRPPHDDDRPKITWDHMRGIGERLYGRADTLDPWSGYEGKALPGAYHGLRSVMKDCLPTDDQVFPLIYSLNTEDRLCRIGEIAGPDVDAEILRAGTGVDWDTAELTRACERILNLERAITIRHWGRDRSMDERVLPAFEYDENWVNPEVGQRMRLDREEFAPVLDEYLRLRGWDVATGWPTAERLESLDLAGVHEPMAEGAEAARRRLPELPPETPVKDHHASDPGR